MMTRVLLTFLVGLVVSLGALASLGSSAAFADTFNCERYTYSGSETSHPKTINLEINGWKKVRSGSKALLKYDKGRKYHLLPNGRMVVDNNAARYKCEQNSGQIASLQGPPTFLAEMPASTICIHAVRGEKWDTSNSYYQQYVNEAKRRGLSCGLASAGVLPDVSPEEQYRFSLGKALANDLVTAEAALAEFRTVNERHERFADATFWLGRVQFMRGQYEKAAMTFSEFNSAFPSDPRLVDTTMWIAESVSHFAPKDQACEIYAALPKLLDNPPSSFMNQLGALASAAKCGETAVASSKRTPKQARIKNAPTQTAIVQEPKAAPKVTSAALTAAEKEAERLRQELAALKVEKAREKQTITNDTKLPMITIASASSSGPQGTIVGRVTDNTGVAEVRMDGKTIKIDSYGNFSESTYVPEGGVSVSIQAVDLAGLSSSMSVRIDRSASTTTASISFESLNPLGRKVTRNKDALALIIGVRDYKNIPVAEYADSDAKVFADYASQILGIPSNRIRKILNEDADEAGMLTALEDWLSRASKKDNSDIYVFFSGHGLSDGKQMYLFPYDGLATKLERTAITRDYLFNAIASSNPRSVTVFLDTCYSGTTKNSKETITPDKPIRMKVLKQAIPDNFTVMTAAAGDQTATLLEEAEHGMFSYFLMKGMEGLADSNQDNKITALELHDYVKENVWQQSSNKQLPELQGDENRVLVQFQ